MKYLIIRDDDINFFTPQGVLERLYAKLWDNGIPITLSVIPSVLSQKKYTLGYNPIVPSQYTDQEHHFDVSENKPLCEYLEKKVRNTGTEICLHGFEHSLRDGLKEFAVNDKSYIKQAVNDGIAILQRSFPSSKIKTFIPPFDALSREGLAVVGENSLNLSINGIPSHWASAQIFSWPTKFKMLIKRKRPFPSSIVFQSNRSKIFFHDGLWFSNLYGRYRTKRDVSLLLQNIIKPARKDVLFVIVNHYWEFFENDLKKETSLYREWDEFVNLLLKHRNEINFTTFDRYP